MNTSDLEVLIKNRKFSEYIRCALPLAQAGKLDPQAQANLAAAYASIGQLTRASEVAHAVLKKIQGQHHKDDLHLVAAISENILGIEARRNRRFAEAADCFKRAHRLHPIDEYLGNYALILKDLGKTSEALQHFRTIFQNKKTGRVYIEGLVLAAYYDDLPLAEKSELVRACGARYQRPAEKTSGWTPALYRPDSVLRVGFVSGDLHQHSVTSFLAPFTQPCARHGVELHYFYTGVPIDSFTKRLVQAADGFHFCHSLTDPELTALIRSQAIDVLIDLSGHTRNNRLAVFAARAAPVQASWLGFGFTSGVPNIDYRLSHDAIDPPQAAQKYYSESVVGIPGAPFCFKPQKVVELQPKPPDWSDPFVFASVTNIARISMRSVAAWSRILERCDKARLLIEYHRDKTNDLNGKYFSELFEQQGISPDRLIFVDTIPGNQYALMNRVDAVLDPFPSNQGTMTFDALYMGVPVITLEGECSMHRLGAGLLELLGANESFIAATEDAYVEKAVDLYRAHPGGFPFEKRAMNRERFLNSVLCNPDRFLAGFFRGIREIYARTLFTHLGSATAEDMEDLHRAMGDLTSSVADVMGSIGPAGARALALPPSPWNVGRAIAAVDAIVDPELKKTEMDKLLASYANNQKLIKHYSIQGVRY